MGRGLLVLLAVTRDDAPEDAQWLARKIVQLRIFPNEAGHMDLPVRDIDGGVLLVSQFTLYASTAKGNRPSFSRAAEPDQAVSLYRRFHGELERELGRPVSTGEFGAYMEISLCNDGPVTLILDSRQRDI